MRKLKVAHIHVSIAELIDRVTILRIKIKHRGSVHFGTQLQQYVEELHRLGVHNCALDGQRFLERINGMLWRLENKIRHYEAQRQFGFDFICTARLIRRLNDRRATAKAHIDELCGSAFADVKNYD